MRLHRRAWPEGDSTVTKVCRSCGEEKPLDAFTRHATCRFGVTARCSACIAVTARRRVKETMRSNPEKILRLQREYNRTRSGKVMMAYHNMRGRVEGIQTKKAHLYAGLEILPRRAFYRWAMTDTTYRRVFSAWVASGYRRNLAPSVNRIDSRKGYVLGNVEWITHGENSRLGAVSNRRKAHAKT